jgi:hypothetical protein
MDKRERHRKIASMQGSENWAAVVEELEEQEKNAFEGLLNHMAPEAVIGTVLILRKIKALPQIAKNLLGKGS